jgi:hypothetical protein
MTCDSGKVAEAIATLVARLQQEQAGGRALSAKESLVLRLDTQYPKDVGVLSAFFLNLVGAPGLQLWKCHTLVHVHAVCSGVGVCTQPCQLAWHAAHITCAACRHRCAVDIAAACDCPGKWPPSRCWLQELRPSCGVPALCRSL